MPEGDGRTGGVAQPTKSSCPDWKGQARWSFALSFILLLIAAACLVTAFYFLSNILALSLRNSAKDPLTLELKVAGPGILAVAFFILCLKQVALSFARGRVLEDRWTRWQAISLLRDELSPEDLLRLIEQGPLQQAQEVKDRQLKLIWPVRPPKSSSQSPPVESHKALTDEEAEKDPSGLDRTSK